MMRGLVQESVETSSSSPSHVQGSGLVGRLLVRDDGEDEGDEYDEDGEEGHDSAGGKKVGVGTGGWGNGYVTCVRVKLKESEIIFARRRRDLSAALESQLEVLELELRLAASSSSAIIDSGILDEMRACRRACIRAFLFSAGSSKNK